LGSFLTQCIVYSSYRKCVVEGLREAEEAKRNGREISFEN